jgi:16S rRNA G1207 methylase RsmC
MKLLDVGCGTGVDDKYIKNKYPFIDITGIDPDINALNIARHNLNGLNIKYYFCICAQYFLL